jgi:ribosomal protein S12 methylthiotransferase
VKTRLRELCERLGDLAEAHGAWVRLHYVYPYPQVDDILPLMAQGRILPYLDVPFQHAHPDVLKRMKRPASGERNLERLQRWRELCPSLVVRSTFIAGFPGETEAEFEHLLDFLREAQLDRVGCFAYSPVDGAAANALPGAVPEEVKQDRLQRFMEIQAEISRDKLALQVGREMTVLIDEVQDGRIIARGPGDAPEVDGLVIIDGDWEDVGPGDFIAVQVTGYDEHDLFAEPVL